MNCPSLSLVKSALIEFPSSISLITNSAKSSRTKRVVPWKFRVLGYTLNLISLVNNNWAAAQLNKIWFTVYKRRPKPWVKKFWNQADRRIEINLSDQSIPVYCWGRGPLVVLMHGWSGSGTQFKHFIPALTKAGYRVAVFDAPAHGTNPGKHSHLLDFTDSLVAIQQQIGPIDTVIAHSFGAMAVTLATRRGLMLNRMVLIAPNLDVQEIFDSYTQLLKLRPKLVQKFKTLISIEFKKILQIDHSWGLFTTINLLEDKYQSGLLVFDSADEEVSQKHFNEIETHWSNSSVIKTQGLGHVRLLKDQDVIGQIISYLKL
ncbi:MAG: alpha/beta hydrolase [Gammaproteobacteria bacterium]|jgi:pimeloyl-ACP methyl ester carboxylesterase|nr:alpha/beta hydrolase [Gammaproteobacteria bacterium]MBT3724124.1 alpha/beta hydrolase [Gammaproteobacteria bacterium]MBT4075524.1 alpha/beta hydrolase [Gammaproteobacteria bacterium]MBT4193931.1 alpha/beta hydrolase [Gammaproteobacteria bacterium]MBT4451229.1 alpha/beta hydrolase [Gammaproteobacteria bacterium]